jgi:hypothetical protein
MVDPASVDGALKLLEPAVQSGVSRLTDSTLGTCELYLLGHKQHFETLLEIEQLSFLENITDYCRYSEP